MSTRGAWLRWIRLPRTVRARLTAVYVGMFVVFGAGLLTITYLLLDSRGPVQIFARGALPPPAAGPDRFCYTSGADLRPAGATVNCADYIAKQVTAQHASDLSTLLMGSGVALAGMTLLAIGIGWLVAGRVLSPLRTITIAAQRISANNLHQRLRLPAPADELKELGDTIDGLLARLECSFEAQRQFVANASHELRTPLARQRTLVEVALADPEPTVENLRGVCGRVLAAGQQQERLIEALLTLARSQRGLDRWELIDLAAVTAEAAAAREGEARRLGIRVNAGAGTSMALGDGRLLERLAANLVDNALQHNLPGGWVTVWTGTSNGQATLRVANSGPVIPPGEVARLFAPFQRLGANRLGSSVGRTTGGRVPERGESPGLGLSIVSAIAAAHGAQLQASALDEGGLHIEVRFTPLPNPVLPSPAPDGDLAHSPADGDHQL